MASKKRIILQVLAYTLYGLVVCLVLVYITFPYDLLRQRVVERFSQDHVRLAIARLRPGFPPGLSLHNVRLLANHLDLPEAVMHMQRLRLQPAWLSLLSGTSQVRGDATLYSGRLQGEIRPSTVNDTSTWEVQGRFADLHLEGYPLVQKDGEAFLRGRLEGDLDLTLDRNGQIQQGVVRFRLQPLVFVGSQGLRLPSRREITCDTVESQLKMAPQQLQIVSFICKGNDLNIQASGTVTLQQPLENSGLKLHLQIRSETAYKQELDLLGTLVRRRPDRRGVLSFSIRGTFRKPHFGT
jgi:type II secretion system protein N